MAWLPNKSLEDLGKRALSTAVLLCIVGGVLYLGSLYTFYFLGLLWLGLWGEALTLFWRTKPHAVGGTGILLLALLIATIACFVMFLLLSQSEGVWPLLWVCTIVWMADSCAYGVGKCVKGPRLAPRFSPQKTWSGSLGGFIGGILGSFVYLWIWGKPFSLKAFCFTAGIVFCAQVGDLLESGAKRFFGVKDSGSLIPGHGGLWDRLNGLLFAFMGLGLSLPLLRIL